MSSRPRVAVRRQRGFTFGVKRALDVVLAGLALVVLAPLLASVAVAIRVESRGPALYRQIRVGRDGVPFTILKFRSMYVDADQHLHERFVKELLRGSSDGRPPAALAEWTNGGPRRPRYKLAADPRVTRVGAVIRRLSIDELPQLINVIRGDMSLVGPRPDVPYAVEEYAPWQRRRFEVLPGLTGLWQVSGRGDLSPAEMLRLDVEYVDRWSLRLDVRLLLATPMAVLRNIGSA